MRRDKLKLIFTCEHAKLSIPPDLKNLFQAHRHLLKTHEGYDIGALQTARAFSRMLKSPLIYSSVSRLVVDLNRSIGHPSLFSKITLPLDDGEKTQILNRFYFPYRTRVETAIRDFIRTGYRVMHVSVHSFTPVLSGKTRKTDIGLLFDPLRNCEKEFCVRLRNALRKSHPDISIHFNLPYRGNTDGLTSALRKRWRENAYLGIECEINQQLFLAGKRREWRQVHDAMVQALRQALLLSFPTLVSAIHDFRAYGHAAAGRGPRPPFPSARS